MKFMRSSGIILHPTSLPGPDGIGDLGPEAYRWVNFLDETGCSLWQVLALGPTGYGDSPYQCFSALAGNPYLISPALLLEEGLLTRKDIADRPDFPAEKVNYGDVIPWKVKILDRAFHHFQKSASPALQAELAEFKEEQAFWLDDYALFMAIKEANGGVSWKDWPEPMRSREVQALKEFRENNAEVIQRHELRQFLFFKQWRTLHRFANEKGIQVIGDVPIFVAYDSAETWSHPELFYLDEKGLPTVVAGVPPDYFSRTGQLWGNPLYRWDVHKKSGYEWWIKRIQATLQIVDIIRLDHFRGFAGYWEVPAKMTTAEKGKWKPGPGTSLFEAIEKALGGLPIIAEDLGKITPDVVALREQFHLPGMKVLQFAFSTDSSDPFLPHNFPTNCVAYTGTHDNDTTRGWYRNAPGSEQDFCRRYLARSGDDIAWDLIRVIWSSAAEMTLAPLQDFLSLGSEGRMNLPGTTGNNWGWRMPVDVFTNLSLITRIKETNYLYYRTKGMVKEEAVMQGHI